LRQAQRLGELIDAYQSYDFVDGILDQPAPKARNMIARGKREARRPWDKNPNPHVALKGRNTLANYFGLSGLDGLLGCYPGATRFALAPGFHIPRLWRFTTHLSSAFSLQ
jgi:hypothetical protein